MAPRRARLLVHKDDLSFSVRLAGPTTAIGAASACTVCVRDAGLGDRHCVIQETEGGHEVFDLFSASGTWLNGRRVEAGALTHGDQIRVGSLRLTYLVEDRISAGPPPAATAPPEVLPFFNEPSAPDQTSRTQDEPPAADRSSMPHRATAALGDARRAARGVFLRVLELRPNSRPGTPTEPPDLHSFAAAKTEADAIPRVEWPLPQAQRAPSFSDELVTALKRAPFFLISLATHAVIAILLHFFVHFQVPPPRKTAVIATLDTLAPPPLFDEAEEEPEEPIEAPVPEDEITDEPELLEVTIAKDDEESPPPDAEPHEPDRSAQGPFSGSGLPGGGLGLRQGGGASSVRAPNLGRRVRQLRISGLDVAVVLDSTGSMGQVLAAARERVGHLVGNLGVLVPGFRFGCVTYRDHGRANEYLTRFESLDANHYRQIAFLDGLVAWGGGDVPEAVSAGLDAAIDGFAWAPRAKRVIVLIGDAPPHESEMEEIERRIAAFRQDGGVVHTLLTRGGESLRPAVNREAELAFRRIAELGGGVQLELEAADALIVRILELVVGTEHASELAQELERLERSDDLKRWRTAVRGRDRAKILEGFAQDPPPPAMARVLLEEPATAFFGVCRSVLEDASAREQARWLAAVLLGRLARAKLPAPRGEEVARELRPNMARKAQTRALDILAEALR